jgi:hypothetical protein
MVTGKGLSATAVTRPVDAFTLATELLELDHFTDRLPVTLLPNESVSFTPICSVVGAKNPERLTVPWAGDTTTLDTCPRTVTLADPEGNPESGLVAVTVAVPAPAPVPVNAPPATVNRLVLADQITGRSVST